jgi:outer membrane protein
MRVFLLLLCFLEVCFGYAQTVPPGQKIGHADWQYIFSQMPEYRQIENDLRSYEAQLQNQLKARSQELETKYKSYQSLPVNTPEAIKKDKEAELGYLQENIERFKQDAQTSMEKKQNELVAMVLEKVGKAIEEVAREEGYSYIINPQMMGGGDVLLFTDEKYNISNLVLQKLGVKATGNKPAAQQKN